MRKWQWKTTTQRIIITSPGQWRLVRSWCTRVSIGSPALGCSLWKPLCNITLNFLRFSDNLNSLLSPVMFVHILNAAIMLSALGFSLMVSTSRSTSLCNRFSFFSFYEERSSCIMAAVCVSFRNNFQTNWRAFIKLGTNIMPLESTPPCWLCELLRWEWHER